MALFTRRTAQAAARKALRARKKEAKRRRDEEDAHFLATYGYGRPR